jgi:hypothetical protein
MTFYKSLSAAGFAATAISYGPARMGFGLFVPQLREAFGLSGAAMFLGAAALPLATLPVLRARHLRDGPAKAG